MMITHTYIMFIYVCAYVYKLMFYDKIKIGFNDNVFILFRTSLFILQENESLQMFHFVIEYLKKI